MTTRYQLSSSDQPGPPVSVEREAGLLRITVGDQPYRAAVFQPSDGVLTLTIDGQQMKVIYAQDGPKLYLHLQGQTYTLERSDTRRPTRHIVGAGGLKASMPGQVIAVLVKVGDEVMRGQVLLILEAMKMETRITAPQAGTITAITCRVGDVVERDQTLVAFKPGKG